MFEFKEDEFDKEVKIVDTQTVEVSWKKLKPFQGRLKTLSAESYQKLKYRILKSGFRYPPFIWIDGKDHYLLDGHQRRAALAKMSKEGYTVPEKIKVIHIPAGSYDEAREMVLELVSQYGDMNEDGFLDFTSGLEDDFASFDFPTFVNDVPDEWDSDLGEVEKTDSNTDGIKKIVKVELDPDEDDDAFKRWLEKEVSKTSFKLKVL